MFDVLKCGNFQEDFMKPVLQYRLFAVFTAATQRVALQKPLYIHTCIYKYTEILCEGDIIPLQYIYIYICLYIYGISLGTWFKAKWGTKVPFTVA